MIERLPNPAPTCGSEIEFAGNLFGEQEEWKDNMSCIGALNTLKVVGMKYINSRKDIILTFIMVFKGYFSL